MTKLAVLALAVSAVALPARLSAQETAGLVPLAARPLLTAATLPAAKKGAPAEPAAKTVRPRPGTQTPADPQGLQPLDVSGQSSAQSGSAFNPAISVIPDGVYYNDNRKGAASAFTSGADGFGAGSDDDAGGHDHGGGVERGFSLRELEISFSGAVDPYFDVWAVVAVGDGEIDAEEAYVQTRRFLPGVQVRFGKFFSGIGYLNRQHPHQWDFVDQALPYSLLFDGSLNEVGLQVTWLPAWPIYSQFGVEALQGENAFFSQHLGPEEEAYFRDAAGPRLFTGFVKISPDLGESHTLQAGFSVAHSRLHQERHEELAGNRSTEGDTTLAGADMVYRFDSGKQWGVGDVTLQAEYLWRLKDLRVVVPTTATVVDGPGVRAGQDGFYLQGVYGFRPRWTAGLRIEAAGLANRIEEDGRTLEYDTSRRYTANLTFNPTEFSRLRLQYARGDFAVAGVREKYHQVWVQLQVSLGAHGAHRF